jgi:leader peptidase (prepilin peptidase)/N-methyltransferase
MVIVILAVVGLCLGSFINAWVWRLHEQTEEADKKKPNPKRLASLSISKGHSMCPDCGHKLAAKDLVPVLSWLSLGGKCRYCHKPISWQYPLVEVLTAGLFITSYICWPTDLRSFQIGIFIWWLILLVGLIALSVYDLRWFLLPNRIIYPASLAAAAIAIITIVNANSPGKALLNTVLAVVVGGGVFYVLFQLSSGKWIGGGDVRLGWLLGLVAGTPGRSVLFIFAASIIGTLISLPLLLSNRLKRSSSIPFGPLLIIGLIITQLFGVHIIHWYQTLYRPN